MTNEDMERMMQFILQQQANFATNQQHHDERMAVLEVNMAELAAGQAELAAGQQATNERVARLEASMADMARSQDHLNEVVAVMLDTHRHTEQKLDAFIGVLERYIAEGRNGKAGGEGYV